MELLYRVARRDHDANLSHPLIDTVLIGVRWADLQPTRRRFEMGWLADQVAAWRGAGKRVALKWIGYGNAEDGTITPEWAYQVLNRVTAGTVSIPYLADPRFTERWLLPIVERLRSLQPDALVIGAGHNGSLCAAPDRQIATALLAAGWTPDAWTEHCGRVTAAFAGSLPLLAVAGFTLLRNGRDNFRPAYETIVDHVAPSAKVITLGLESRAADMDPTVQRCTRLLRRKGPIGIGDDFPLWVEPGPRRTAAPTFGRDDADFAASLHQAELWTERRPGSVLLLQEPEIAASNPSSGANFVPAVHAALLALKGAN